MLPPARLATDRCWVTCTQFSSLFWRAFLHVFFAQGLFVLAFVLAFVFDARFFARVSRLRRRMRAALAAWAGKLGAIVGIAPTPEVLDFTRERSIRQLSPK
jgi:hypothetical protein